LFWRIRILLWLLLLAGGWFVLRAYGLLAGAAVAVLIEAKTSYRKRDGRRAAPVAVRNDTRRTARPTSPWETDATPSPGGWLVTRAEWTVVVVARGQEPTETALSANAIAAS
jgi:hypothetical protein